MQIHINELASRAPYSDAERAVTSLEDARDALAEVERWPRYAPTPLRDLPGTASELGLAKVWMKVRNVHILQLCAGRVAANAPGQRRIADHRRSCPCPPT